MYSFLVLPVKHMIIHFTQPRDSGKNSDAVTGRVASNGGMSGDFERGYTLGQASVYVEQVLAGAKLAAHIGCKQEFLADVLDAVIGGKCLYETAEWCEGRAAVWIFKHEFVRTLIRELDTATPPTAAGVWAMGKLFGYSDAEIGPYLNEHGLAMFPCGSGSNLHRASDKSEPDTEA